MTQSFTYLGYSAWPRLARLTRAGPEATCDLSGVRVVYPAGIVAATLLTHDRGRRELETRLLLPENPDVRSYLRRVDFFDRLHPRVRFDAPVEEKGGRRRDNYHLTELLTGGDGSFDEVLEVLRRFVREKVARGAPQKVLRALSEGLLNVEDHSGAGEGPAAQHFVHVQVYKGRLEGAVGDLGRGFRASLNTSPHFDFASEAAALRAALTEARSRLAHRATGRERGGGLRAACRAASSLGGEVRLVSGDGRAWHGSGGTAGEPTFQEATWDFPGTLLHVRIPEVAAEPGPQASGP